VAYSPSRANKKRSVPAGRISLKVSQNNTIATVSTADGATVLGWASGGNCQQRFKGPRQATPFAASLVIERALEIARGVGMEKVDIFVKGVTRQREQAIRAINSQGMEILSIHDVTPFPHGGCRPAGRRRV